MLVILAAVAWLVSMFCALQGCLRTGTRYGVHGVRSIAQSTTSGGTTLAIGMFVVWMADADSRPDWLTASVWGGLFGSALLLIIGGGALTGMADDALEASPRP